MEKSKEQIELAQKTAMDLQDYIELAKTQKKLKDKNRAKNVEEIIDETTQTIKNNVENL